MKMGFFDRLATVLGLKKRECNVLGQFVQFTNLLIPTICIIKACPAIRP